MLHIFNYYKYFLLSFHYSYVSAPEAIWRISEYNMHSHSHTIIRMPVHLPAQQQVYFRPGHIEEALDNAQSKPTQLTAWFQLNKSNKKATQFLFPDIPLHYIFKANKWVQRKRNKDKIISRMYSVNPLEGERYYLRLLLLHVPGAISFAALRTVDNTVYPSFRAACAALHLLDDDANLAATLADASTYQMPRQFRMLFATICSFCHPSNALDLWLTYKDSLTEDFLRTMHPDNAYQQALHDIDSILLQSGKISLSITPFLNTFYTISSP